MVEGVNLENAELGINNLEELQIHSNEYLLRLRKFNLKRADFLFENYAWDSLSVDEGHSFGKIYKLRKRDDYKFSISDDALRQVNN